MIELAKLALGAFLGIVAGLAIQWWKSSRDEYRFLVDEFCSTVKDAADTSSAYWRSDASDPSASTSASNLSGYQRRLDGYRLLIANRLGDVEREQLERALEDFFDAISGGDFETSGRRSSTERATAAQVAGAELVLAAREGFMRSMRFRSTVRHKLKAPAAWMSSMANWPRR